MKTTMKKLAAGTFIALMFIAGSIQAKGTEISASSHESIESSLEIESWMISETVWNTELNRSFILEQDVEENLEIESWMTNEETWNIKSSLIQENESNLKIEDWMLSEETWK